MVTLTSGERPRIFTSWRVLCTYSSSLTRAAVKAWVIASGRSTLFCLSIVNSPPGTSRWISNATRLLDDDEPQVLQALGASGQAIDVFFERLDVREDLRPNRFGHLRFGLSDMKLHFLLRVQNDSSTTFDSFFVPRADPLRRLMSYGIRTATLAVYLSDTGLCAHWQHNCGNHRHQRQAGDKSQRSVGSRCDVKRHDKCVLLFVVVARNGEPHMKFGMLHFFEIRPEARASAK